jgi:NAD(P)-dependent dehydrogenase (short-subunit alcohol dehydrogenase family)
MRGNTIMITGGGSGIGRAAALLCADRGARVAVLDLRGDAANTVAADARLHGCDAIAIACDVTVESQVTAAFAAVHEQLGAPQGLFCAAGIDVGGMIHELELVTWERIMATNLRGVFLCCKHALRSFLANNTHGSIVCTSSPAALRGLPGGTGAYSASKAGISALVRCMAIDYAPYGIRVNAILPGATDTGMMWANVRPENIESMRRTVESEIPLGRIARADEPAQAAVWLLSDQASYITGSELVCDGGVMAKAPLSV